MRCKDSDFFYITNMLLEFFLFLIYKFLSLLQGEYCASVK